MSDTPEAVPADVAEIVKQLRECKEDTRLYTCHLPSETRDKAADLIESQAAQLAAVTAERDALKAENDELRGACLSEAMQATPLTPLEEAIAAGDGTLHGANALRLDVSMIGAVMKFIDYWQEQAFAMTAERDKLKADAELLDWLDSAESGLVGGSRPDGTIHWGFTTPDPGDDWTLRKAIRAALNAKEEGK